jgi:hypothetical protein
MNLLLRKIAGRAKYVNKSPSQYHFVSRKTHVHWHEIHILQRQGNDNTYPCYYVRLWHYITVTFKQLRIHRFMNINWTRHGEPHEENNTRTYITSNEDQSSLINDTLMKAQGLVNFGNISHCMSRNNLNDRRVVRHSCMQCPS